jgi:ABC-type Zn uptake system ZnuABC Zn-binding protein ZnuA
VVLAVLAAASLFDFWPKRPPPSEHPRLRLLTTFLPVHVFVLNVTADVPGVVIELMVPADLGCPHSYTARPVDHVKLAKAEAIIANGLDMEPFLAGFAKNHPDKKIITISDDCDVIQSAHDHEHHGHDHAEHACSTINGHVWVSPRQASQQVRTLAKKLGELDPSHAERYRYNGEAFVGRLAELDRQLVAASHAFAKRAIVTTHDAFDYLARDLNLKVVATLQLEHDQPPSARQMGEIIETIKRDQAAAVFYESRSSEQLARTIARDAGVPVLELNPFNATAETPSADSYERAMRSNLQILQQVLGGGS